MSVLQVRLAAQALRRQVFERLRSVPLHLLAALGLCSMLSAPALADVLREAFDAAHSTVATEGWNAQLVVVHDRRVTVALGARYRNRE